MELFQIYGSNWNYVKNWRIFNLEKITTNGGGNILYLLQTFEGILFMAGMNCFFFYLKLFF